MNEVILRTTARLAAPIIAVYALYLLLRGHNEPGGGFIAGLVSAAALTLMRMAGMGLAHPSADRRRKRWDFASLAALGLLVAALTGIGAMLAGRPFLTSAVVALDLPVLGHVELASAVLFDVGVFLVVVGTAMTIVERIGTSR